jgi:CheY-like chemotaxis protein
VIVITKFAEPHATRILVVDDEVAVGAIVARILEDVGYGVCLAFSGALALAALESSAYDFALALSDIRMPGMSGIELAHKIQRGWPDLPILLMSGYESSTMLVQQGLGNIPLLRKPFGREELLAFVTAAFTPAQPSAVKPSAALPSNPLQLPRIADRARRAAGE